MGFTPKYLSIIEERRSSLRIQLDRLLPPDGNITVEVGCGHGHFLTAYAQAHPDRVCVGIDLIGERIERACKKRNRARLSNLHFIQAEARLFLDTLPAHARLSALFILFPDPWPKLRHNKHRIVQPTFLAAAATVARPDCPLYFRTDFGPYFQAARDVIANDPYWKVSDEPWPFEFVTVFQQRAESFHSLVARCKSHPASANSPSAFQNAE